MKAIRLQVEARNERSLNLFETQPLSGNNVVLFPKVCDW